MKVVLDTERCSGHARCAATAPELFTVDDDGYSDIGVLDVAPGMEEHARLGVASCPEQALTIVDDRRRE